MGQGVLKCQGVLSGWRAQTAAWQIISGVGGGSDWGAGLGKCCAEQGFPITPKESGEPRENDRFRHSVSSAGAGGVF